MIEAPCKQSLVVNGCFLVRNDRGLHTRPCTEIVKCTTQFKSEVRLVYQKYQVNAKSILGLLMLAAPRGAKIRLEAIGEDAEEAVEALLTLAHHQFHVQY